MPGIVVHVFVASTLEATCSREFQARQAISLRPYLKIKIRWDQNFQALWSALTKMKGPKSRQYKSHQNKSHQYKSHQYKSGTDK